MTTDAGWTLTQTGYDTETSRAYEGLFTQGSGYLHTRGSLEESIASAPQNTTYLRMPANVTAETFASTPVKWGTYVPGLFGPHPTLNSEMINLPWFLEFALEVEGEKLDMSKSAVRRHVRTLDMGSATLTRTLEWQTKSGATLAVTYERFISAVRPALSVQRVTLRADRMVEVTARAGIDADVRTNGFDHFTKIVFTQEECGGSCTVETNGGDSCSMLSRVHVPDGEVVNARVEARLLSMDASLSVVPDVALVVEKRTAVATSVDLELRTVQEVLDEAAALSYDALHQEHAARWAERWDGAGVVVEGDDRTQNALRASIFHLLRSHVTGDSRVAVDAKGYAGDAYYGRFFWDTEMYLMPFYLYTDPERAGTFADFRVRSLPAAQENARAYGYPGARFPWESDKQGNECCPCWQYMDHEIHITADVVYGLEHCAAVLGWGALRAKTVETVVEAARYWMARMDIRAGESHPSLLGVMGPDEYTPISSNNAYTNWMVARALRLAAELGPQGGASREEREAFRAAADSLPILRDSINPNLILQCEEWPQLAEPDYESQWPGREGCYVAAVSQERLYRTKCPKQADVIMLQTLFPLDFTDAECRAAWDEYVPYTTHDSSLSVGIHALMALRLDMRDAAYEYFQKGLYKDLDVKGGGAEDGIHIAGCGCNWMVAIFGFAGLLSALQSNTLSLHPRLPRQWSRLAFPVMWKGSPAYVSVMADGTTVTNRGDRDLAVSVWGEQRILPAGQQTKW